jgi:protein transport protein SEC61 subunit alpha
MIYNNDMTIKGLKNNESILKILEKLIPTAAILGGALIGLFSVLSDMMKTIISGTSMFMVLGIIFNYYEEIAGGKSIS